MLLALATVWGASFFFNGVAVRDLPSFNLGWARVAVAAAALLLVLRLLGQRMPREGHVWAAFFGMGLLNNVVPFVLIVWGQHRIASGLASILNATTPLFTVLVAHLLTADEKLTSLKAAGVVVGFAGAAVMIGPDALSGVETSVQAQLACLAAALSYAFAGIFGRKVPARGCCTAHDCGWPTQRFHLDATADHAVGGQAVGAGGAARVHLGRRVRVGTHLYRARLCALFSHSGRGRGDQPAAGHVLDTRQGHSARCAGSARNAAAPALPRHGADRGGAGFHG